MIETYSVTAEVSYNSLDGITVVKKIDGKPEFEVFLDRDQVTQACIEHAENLDLFI